MIKSAAGEDLPCSAGTLGKTINRKADITRATNRVNTIRRSLKNNNSLSYVQVTEHERVTFSAFLSPLLRQSYCSLVAIKSKHR